ncbi:helix-turn-helix domain-containing protein [Acidobacteriota bacterium]
MEKLLTVSDAAAFLNCHEMTVRKLMSSKEIPYIKKKGLGIRFRKTDLNRWLEEDLRFSEGWAATP